MIFQLAFRNILRHRGRLILSASVIAITSLLLVYATAQLGGVRAALARGIADTLTGHIQIKPAAAPRDFFDYPSAQRLAVVSAADLDQILDKLKSISAVEAASPRIRFGALIGNEERSTPAMIMAVNAAAERAVTPDLAAVIAPLSDARAALLSEHLIKKSGIAVGKEALVLTDTPNDSFGALTYTIAGTASSPVLIDEFMAGMMLVDLSSVRKLLNLGGGATEIAIRLKPGEEKRMPQVISEIEAILSPEQKKYLGVYSYDEVVRSAKNMSDIATGIGAIQVGTVMFVMLTIVLIVTKMGLHERRAEIGTLMSLGMPRSRLVCLFLSEVLIKVLIGYGLGFFIAMFVLTGVRESGGVKAVTQVDQYLYGGKIMMPVIDAGNILLGLAVVVAASLLTTLASCWKASGQDAVALLSAKN